MTFHEALVAHYNASWGPVEDSAAPPPPPRADFAWDPEFRILVFPPRKSRPLFTYATLGMSRHAAAPIEAFLFSPLRTSAHVELLVMLAYFNRTTALGVGHTVEFGRPWMAGSRCGVGLLSLPYLDGPRIEKLRHHDEQVDCLWLLPITKAERQYKIAHGLEALEAAFEAKKVAYASPDRESVIPEDAD